jgi:hypothetical protein
MVQGKAKITKEDKIWSLEIKNKFNNKCVICGSTEKLNAHHLIPRQIKKFKHDLENGICLCPKHHRFSFELSAHQNPIAFIMWLEKYKPEIIKKIKNKIKID